ncbi:MAG: transposase, partial [Candidatus Marinimicrobia bacterium]|nr:transposase [Candidatus Neomarinimicrobiota bacterium]
MQNWDYSWDGKYFITICTKNRRPYFGDIEFGKMILNDIGKLAYRNWSSIPDHFPFVYLGEFVVMPNHIHGIIEIAKPYFDGVANNNFMDNDNTTVETRHALSQQPPLSGQQPPLSGQQPPLSGQQPPLSGQQPPLSGQQPPLSGQQPPLSG